MVAGKAAAAAHEDFVGLASWLLARYTDVWNRTSYVVR